jgi:2-iminobutanoate/2-iminopropanoate deaminase
MKAIHTAMAPAAIGPYSQAVEKNGMTFISGQLGVDPVTSELGKTIEIQAEQAFLNLEQILIANNQSLANVVKVTIYLKDMLHFEHINEIYQKHFREPYPAREVVEISRLPLNAFVEVSAIAMD